MAKRGAMIEIQVRSNNDSGDAWVSKRFGVGDLVLVADGKVLTSTVKQPAFRSRFFDPWRIYKASHPSYWLTSYSGGYSGQAIHARRLIPYIMSQIHLHN